MSLAAILSRRGSLLDDAHDVGLLHDQQLLAVDLDLGARPLAEQDGVAFLDVRRNALAGLVAGAGADRQHLALHRFLLGRIGDDHAARRALLFVDPADDHPVVQRLDFHEPLRALRLHAVIVSVLWVTY
jgi:hypothetical protein